MASAVTGLSRKGLAPLLTDLGWEHYRPRDFRLRNEAGDEACINIQASSFGSDDVAGFYVNISVVLRSLWESAIFDFGGDLAERERPDYHDIGHVLNVRLDPADAHPPHPDYPKMGLWWLPARPAANQIGQAARAVVDALDAQGWLKLLPETMDRVRLLDLVLDPTKPVRFLDNGAASPAAIALLVDDGSDEAFQKSLGAVEASVAEFPAMERIATWARKRRARTQ